MSRSLLLCPATRGSVAQFLWHSSGFIPGVFHHIPKYVDLSSYIWSIEWHRLVVVAVAEITAGARLAPW